MNHISTLLEETAKHINGGELDGDGLTATASLNLADDQVEGEVEGEVDSPGTDDTQGRPVLEEPDPATFEAQVKQITIPPAYDKPIVLQLAIDRGELPAMVSIAQFGAAMLDVTVARQVLPLFGRQPEASGVVDDNGVVLGDQEARDFVGLSEPPEDDDDEFDDDELEDDE